MPPGTLEERGLGSAFRNSQPLLEIQMARKKASPVRHAMTKTQMLGEIADSTGLSRKQVASVLNELSSVIERHIKKRGFGQFTMPGLFKIKTMRKPATRARKGINPFTGEEMMFKAKPARNVVKILPLKNLKEMA